MEKNSHGIDNRLLEPFVDGTLVKGVYIIKLEEGLVSWWPPQLDDEISTLIANISVPMVNGLYFVIGNGFFPEIQVRRHHNVEGHTTVQDRAHGERGPDRREAEQDHPEGREEEELGPLQGYPFKPYRTASLYNNSNLDCANANSLMEIIPGEYYLK
ncbi:MAG: hypothetical protein LRS43_00465 [Desulfurococcales archaeon]|nr:hypothetical protein [Desulfurococcales archaeon]